MKKKMNFIQTIPIAEMLLFLIATIHYSNGQCLSENDQLLSPTTKSELYRGQQSFTISLLDSINKATPNENIFFSPYSTYHALLLAYFGAKNQTEKELSKTLNLDWAKNKMHVMQAYRFETQMRAKRSKMSPSIEFTSADKIFIEKSVELRECMTALFNNELEAMDFKNTPDKCRKDINQWVENVTKNQIKDILKEGDIDADTNIVLANAAYFKGQWASKFDPNDTEKGIFYTSPEKQNFVDMMYKQGTFNLGISERLGAHILELPYLGEDDISMIILLPPFVPNALDTVLSRLTPDTLQQALTNEGTPREIEVKLPKFTFEKTLELVPILKRMGISDLFENSNLSGFTKQPGSLSLGKGTHKAKIEVNEEGSTAAAATVLFTFRSARLEPTKFVCDHPFIFLIYDSKSDAILFSGIYRGPEN